MVPAETSEPAARAVKPAKPAFPKALLPEMAISTRQVLKRGDLLLVCTDGLWANLTDPEMGAVWKGEADDYGAACRLRNHYHCDDCDESWTDDWSCACDDKCPKCGKAIMPHDSVELGWDGEPVPVELVAEGAQ